MKRVVNKIKILDNMQVGDKPKSEKYRKAR